MPAPEFLNLTLSSPFKIAKFWSGYLNAEPYYQFYRADLSAYSGLQKVRNAGPGFNAYISNNLNLIKGIDTEISSWFNYASRSSIYRTRAISSVDLSLKKQLVNSKLTIRLAVRDVFNTQRWAQRSIVGKVDVSTVRKWESQGVFAGASYRFGNTKLKSAERNPAATEEQQRIKARN